MTVLLIIERGARSARGRALVRAATSSDVPFSLLPSLSYVYSYRRPIGTHCGCPYTSFRNLKIRSSSGKAPLNSPPAYVQDIYRWSRKEMVWILYRWDVDWFHSTCPPNITFQLSEKNHTFNQTSPDMTRIFRSKHIITAVRLVAHGSRWPDSRTTSASLPPRTLDHRNSKPTPLLASALPSGAKRTKQLPKR
jgi:hypothetical protein